MVDSNQPQDNSDNRVEIPAQILNRRNQIQEEVMQGQAKLKSLLILKSYIHNWSTLFQALREHLSNLEDAALDYMWKPIAEGGLAISRAVLRPELTWTRNGDDGFQLTYKQLNQDGTSVNYWLGSIQYDIQKGGKLIFRNNGRIPKKAILLGGSTKQNDINLIGKFGEGFKVANLLLLRFQNANGEDDSKPCKIYNGPIEWEFVLLDEPDIDNLITLHYIERIRSNLLTEQLNEVVVEIGNIKQHEWREVWKTKFLALTDIPIIRLTSPARYSKNNQMVLGEILYHPEMTGKVFNQGIYVCEDPKMKYFGVNYFNLTLNRDRSSVQDPYERNIMFTELIIDVCHNYDSRAYQLDKEIFFRDVFNSLRYCGDNDLLSTFGTHTAKPIYKGVCNQLYSIYLNDFCRGNDGVIDYFIFPNHPATQLAIQQKIKLHGLDPSFYRCHYMFYSYILTTLQKSDTFKSIDQRIFEVLENAPDIEIDPHLVQQRELALQWIRRVYQGQIPELKFRNFDPHNRQYRYRKSNMLYLSSLIFEQPKLGPNAVSKEIFVQVAEVLDLKPSHFVILFE